jgi:predicted double-glycine peptidase
MFYKILFIFLGIISCINSGVLVRRHKIIAVPIVSQNTGYTCGVAALNAMLWCYGKQNMPEKVLAQILNVSRESGADYFMILKYMESIGLHPKYSSRMTINMLQDCIDLCRPVLCVIQAWEDFKCDYKDKWDSGHYVLAIGYDSDKIYFMDPSLSKNYGYMVKEEFLARWHDITADGVKLIHFGIVIMDEPLSSNNFIYGHIDVEHID